MRSFMLSRMRVKNSFEFIEVDVSVVVSVVIYENRVDVFY